MRALLSCFFIILREVDLEISPLIIGEILGLFVNTLTAEDKYPVEDWDNLQLPIQMQLSENSKNFLNFFLNFWNLHNILNIFKKR